MQKKRPILVLVRGLPGSGKSFIVNELSTKLNSNELTILDPDATDYSSKEYRQFTENLSKEDVPKKFHPYRFLRAQAYEGIKSGNIIFWNQAFTDLDGFQKTVINLTNFAEENEVKLPILVLEINVSEQTARKRVSNRAKSGGHDVPQDRFNKFIEEYRTFANEGFNVIEIDGENTDDNSYQKILDAIQRLRT